MVIQEQHNPQTTVPVPEVLQFEQSGEEGLDLGELLQVLNRRKWLMLGIIVAVLGLGVLYTLYLLLKHPTYESAATILVAASSNRSAANSDLPILSDLQELTQARSVETQVEIVSSQDLLEPAYENMSLEDRLQGFEKEHYVTDETKKDVTVTAKKNTDVITVTVRARRARSAAAYANQIANMYLLQDLQQQREATRKACEYLEGQLKTVRRAYDDANGALAAFKERTGLASPDEQLIKLADALADLRTTIDKTNADAAAGQRTVDTLRNEMGQMPGTVVAETDVSNNPRVDTSLAYLDTLYDQRATTLQEYTANSPEVKALDACIAEEKARLKQLATSIVAKEIHLRHPVKDEVLKDYAEAIADAAANHARLASLQAKYQEHMRDFAKLPVEEKQLARLMLDADTQKNTLDLLEQQYQTLLISEQSTLSNIRVVANARPSLRPATPVVSLNIALFLLLGIMCSVGVVTLLERLDDVIRDQETAEKLTGLITLGTVHAIKEGENRIIGKDDQRSLLVDRFRVLRNNISFSSLGRKMRLISITSTGPGEGKSTCSTNLGIVTAMDGRQVLIVDCDLHRPSLHNLLKTPRGIGFTNVLMGNCALNDAIVPTEYEGLHFLPSGILPPNPSELLNAQPTRQLFRELADRYDLVIFDCPPCVMLSDMQIISTITDGMLIVVGMDQTFKGGLLHTYQALNQVSAPLIGLIINRVDMDQRYGYHGYYHYYGKYRSYYAHNDDETAENGKTSKDGKTTKSHRHKEEAKHK